MEIDDLRRFLATLLETASNFKDVADLDQIFVQTAAAINDASGSEDLEISEDLCIRGSLSLFESAKAAKDRGKSCCPYRSIPQFLHLKCFFPCDRGKPTSLSDRSPITAHRCQLLWQHSFGQNSGENVPSGSTTLRRPLAFAFPSNLPPVRSLLP